MTSQDILDLRAFCQQQPSPRTISVIAAEINTFYMESLMNSPGKVLAWVAYTKPYQQAMRDLHYITDRYFQESAYEIVLRFVANATSWRGDNARRIKAELNALLESCPEDKRL